MTICSKCKSSKTKTCRVVEDMLGWVKFHEYCRDCFKTEFFNDSGE